MAVANPNSMSGAAEDRAAQEIDMHDFTLQVDNTYHALRAFNFMMEYVHEYIVGGIPVTIAGGMSHLLHRQLDDFDKIRNTADTLAEQLMTTDRAATNEGRLAEAIRAGILAAAGRPAWHDLDTIATRARVRKCDLARVMLVLTGEDHAGPAYRAWDGNLSEGVHAHLLSGLCWEALARCDMWGQVSTATGLGLEKVQEVLQAMLEYSPLRERISLEPFAEVRAARTADAEMRARVAEQDAERPSEQAVMATLDRLRGADLAEIARAANLQEETVRRVLDRLLADPGPDDRPAVSNG
ncbi:MAG: hypothetical protein LBE86_00905 [Gemmobacter sp.]|jgi:hypothetical protein|nr:hypothetical protein [Gemmobacter sp.]